jgi:hypothetical protein
LIAPDRFLAHRVSRDVCLRRVRARHDLLRALADLGPQMRLQLLSERHCYTRQNRFDGFVGHALSPQNHYLTNKNKTKPHRPDRVRRKR